MTDITNVMGPLFYEGGVLKTPSESATAYTWNFGASDYVGFTFYSGSTSAGGNNQTTFRTGFDIGVAAAGTAEIQGMDPLKISTPASDDLTLQTGNDLVIKLGDASGANKLSVTDSSDAEMLAVTSDGDVTVTNDLFVTGDARITGDLTVSGTTHTTEAETVLIGDNHLYLNDGYTVNAAQTGGLVINRLPTATTDTVAAGGFTAGVAATSNPTVITTASATFSTSDFLQVSGTPNSTNDGLYEVLTHTGTTLTIRGIGTTGCVEDFTQNQFTTDTTVQGSIYKVNISVIRANADGDAFEVGYGANTPVSFVDLATSAGQTLQAAYVAGNTITTSGGEGNLTFNGTEDFIIGGSVTVDFDTTDAISLDADLASNFTVAGADLTLSTTSSGEVDITSAGLMDLNAGANLDIDVTGTYTMDSTGSFSIDGVGASNVTADSGALTLSTTTSGAVTLNGTDGINLQGNASEIDITTTGDIDVNFANMDMDGSSVTIDTTSGISLDAGANSNFSATGLTLEGSASVTVNSTGGTLTLNGTGQTVDLNSAALDIDATDAVTIDGSAGIALTAAGAATLTSTGGVSTLSSAAAMAGAIVINASNAGGGIDIDAGTEGIIVDTTGAISLDSAGASNFSTSSGLLTLAGAGGMTLTSTGGTFTLDGTGQTQDINAGDLDIDCGGTFDVLAAGAFSIDGTGASNVTATSGNLTLSTATSGTLALSAVATLDMDAVTVDMDATDVDIDATNDISLDAGAASNFTTSAGAITIDGAGGVNVAGNAAEIDVTTTGAFDVNVGSVDLDSTAGLAMTATTMAFDPSSTFDLDAAGAITIDGASFTVGGDADTGAIAMTATAATATITAAGINLAGGSSEIDVTTTGALDLNSAAGTWDSSAGIALTGATASSFSSTSGVLTLSGYNGVNVSSDNGTNIQLAPAATLDVNCVNMDVDATTNVNMDAGAGISLDAGNNTNLTMTANDASDKTLTIAATNAGDGAGLVSMTSDGSMTITAGAASTWSTSAGALTLDGAGGVNIAGNAAEVDITTTGALDVNVGSVDLDSTAGIAIDGTTIAIAGTGASSFGVTGAALTLSTTTSGNVDITAADDINLAAAGSDIDMDAATLTVDMTGAVSIDGVGASNLTIDSGALTVSTTTSGALNLTGADGISLTGDATFSGVIKGTDDGTGVVVGHAGAEASKGSTLQVVSVTTTQRDYLTGVNGMMIYNTTTGQFEGYDDGWTALGGGGAVPGTDYISWTVNQDATGAADEDASLILKSGDGSSNVDTGTLTYVFGADGSDLGQWKMTADFDLDGTLDVDNDTTSVDSSGAISLDAGAASNFTTSAGALTLDGAGGVNIAGNAAEIDVTTSGALDLNSGAGTWDASNLTLTAVGNLGLIATGDNRTITIEASSATSTLDVNINGPIEMDATASSHFTVDNAQLQLSTVNGGEIDITSAANVDINSGAGTWDASTLSLDSTDTTNLTMTANDAGTKTLTISATNGGAGASDIDIDADGGITIDAGQAISLGGAAASDFTVSNNIDIETTGVGILTLTSANDLDMVAAGMDIDAGATGFDLDSTGAITIDSSAGVSIDGAGASNLTTSSGDLTLSATTNSVVITGSEGVADAVDINATTGGIDIDAASGIAMNTSAGPISIGATAAMAGAIVIDATGNAAGGVDIDAGTGGFAVDTTGALSLDSTGTVSNLTLAANDAGPATLTIAATNAGAGSAAIDMDCKAAFTLDAGSFSIDGTGDSNVTVTGSGQSLNLIAAGGGAQKLNLSSAGTGTNAVDINATAGGIDIDASSGIDLAASTGPLGLSSGAAMAGAIVINASNAAGGIDIDALTGGIAVDTTGSLSLDTTKNANLTVTANSAGPSVLAIASSNAGAGTGDVDIDATDAITLDSSAGGISLDAAAASNFTAAAGNLTLAATTNNVVITAGSKFDVDTTGAVEIDATGISLDSSAAANFTTSAGDLTLASAVDIHLDATGEVVTNSDMVADTGGVAAGDVLYIAANGKLGKADNDVAAKAFCVGIAANAAAEDAKVELAGIPGTLAVVSTSLSSWGSGDVLYLDATAGAVTTTAPSTSGSVVYRVGYIVNKGTDTILYSPQYIATIP